MKLLVPGLLLLVGPDDGVQPVAAAEAGGDVSPEAVAALPAPLAPAGLGRVGVIP